ncbi:ATP-binding protein [Vibrio sp. JC009]|uniref:ATP-binding protein n=1 Tax=Vibrio sp. JC009 TaxID=2912314 RepID=UPI0023B0176E|nr:ATP-binding protein [Vibrio sp. JC009]WED24486.1 ATP-binding protein [Vibrio sp. JC009]
MINSNFEKGLQNYLNNKEVSQAEALAERVKVYYSDTYGWVRISQSPHLWAGLIDGIGEMPPPAGMGRRGERPVTPGEHVAEHFPQTAFAPLGLRINLLDSDGRSILGLEENLQVREKDLKLNKVEITKNQQVIGYISIVQNSGLSDELVASFYEQQTESVFFSASITILFAFGIAFLLVRHFLKPLSLLSEGTQRIEKGELDFRIETRGTDELSDLIRTFNRVVESLKNQKESRAQWLSDISHELRTPIAVLRSELEAIQDGIRLAEPKYINSLHQQVVMLGKLVGDLHQLSVSDVGSVIETDTSVDVADILKSAVFHSEARFRQKEIGVTLDMEPGKLSKILGDEKSLNQLFTNLLENSYRYTAPKGHAIVRLKDKPDVIALTFEDSFPGVPDASLPKLFERLYRVDKSRSRNHGGSGLGLSICQNIVKAHQGTICAEHAPLGGLRICITLPKTKKYHE